MSEFAMEKIVRNAWYIGAWSDELDEKPLARTILCENLVIFRERNGTARVLEDRCCHRGVRLSLGSVEKDGIMCGYHGLVYNGSGICVDNPGEKPNHSYRVRSYPVIERQQFIWVWTGNPELADENLHQFPVFCVTWSHSWVLRFYGPCSPSRPGHEQPDSFLCSRGSFRA